MLTKNTYVIEKDCCLYLVKEEDGETIDEQITNFVPKILAEVIQMNGDEITGSYYRVSVISSRGEVPGFTTIETADFNKMNWPSSRFASLAESEAKTKRLVRQFMIDNMKDSCRYIEFKTPGYYKMNEKFGFAHRSGIVGIENHSQSFIANFTGKHEGFDFSCLDGDYNRVDSAYSLIYLKNIGGDSKYLGALLLCIVWRSVLTMIDDLPYDPIFIMSASGTRKSEIARLLNSCYGPERRGSHHLLQWNHTLAKLNDDIASQRGGLIVVDDFVYKQDGKNITELNDKADKIIRGMANKALRQSKASVPASILPIMIMTGEHWFINTLDSMDQRTIACEPSGISLSALTKSQELADSGQLATGTGDFMKFAISNREKISTLWKKKKTELCEEVLIYIPKKSHSRRPEQFAAFLFCAYVYGKYMAEIGCKSYEINRLMKEVRSAVIHLACIQEDIVKGHSPAINAHKRLKYRVKKGQVSLSPCGKQYAETKAYSNEIGNKVKPVIAGYIDKSSGTIMLNAEHKPSDIFGRSWLEKMKLPSDFRQFYKAMARLGLLVLPVSEAGRLTHRVRLPGHTNKTSFYELRIKL